MEETPAKNKGKEVVPVIEASAGLSNAPPDLSSFENAFDLADSYITGRNNALSELPPSQSWTSTFGNDYGGSVGGVGGVGMSTSGVWTGAGTRVMGAVRIIANNYGNEGYMMGNDNLLSVKIEATIAKCLAACPPDYGSLWNVVTRVTLRILSLVEGIGEQVVFYLHVPLEPHFLLSSGFLRLFVSNTFLILVLRKVSWFVAYDCAWRHVRSEIYFVRFILLYLHATIVYCDNVSDVYLSSNPVQHQHTKHIEIDIHFVRDLVATGQVHVLHVPSRF
ncbi:ribonuclease H-like domain-containing protein [Tanacetum coccineum]